MARRSTTGDKTYHELYKVLRPRKWGGIIGQKTACEQLLTMVKRPPTALILSGPRGCGKTSTALLFAKSLNCLNPQPDGNPCNECSVCKNIDNNCQLGVTYVSMANINGVASVRELIQMASTTKPVKRQIIILDEAHNASAQAWDAMLIPFESTNLNTTFILCTTNPRKVPDTVLSRAQTVKFSLVKHDVMLKYLQQAVAHLGIETEGNMLEVAVREGRGSVRDTLTKLETLLAGGKLEDFSPSTLVAAMVRGDLSLQLQIVDNVKSTGQDMTSYLEDAYSILVKVFIRLSGSSVKVPLADEDLAKFKSPAEVSMMLRHFGDAVTTVALGAADSSVLLSVALVRIDMARKRMEKHGFYDTGVYSPAYGDEQFD